MVCVCVCYVMLCCAVLSCAIRYGNMLCCIMLRCAAMCYILWDIRVYVLSCPVLTDGRMDGWILDQAIWLGTPVGPFCDSLVLSLFVCSLACFFTIRLFFAFAARLVLVTNTYCCRFFAAA